MKTQKNKFNPLTQIGYSWNIVFLVILLAAAVLVIAPLLIVVISSFASERSILTVGFSYTPRAFSLDGYKYLFKLGDQLKYGYVISIFYAVAGTASSLTVMSLYSYVLWQRQFAARRFFTWFLFITMLFSGGLVPGYVLITRYLHINNTLWMFILPGLANGGNIIILRTFLKTSIPDSLVESARIDGAGHFRIFGYIVLPLFKAGLATIGLFGFVSRWNDWFLAFMYNTNARLMPLQTMLYKIQSNIDFLKNNAAFMTTPDGLEVWNSLPSESVRMACVVMVVIPILFAYPFFQRFFISGLLVGSIKE